MATIKLKSLAHFGDLALPRYESAGAAGFDIRAAVHEDVLLAVGARMAVPTGLIFEIPAGFEVQIRPRSGLALKHGITCLNTPGTVDTDYRGEVKVILANFGTEDFLISRGDRIAQAVLAPIVHAIFETVEEVSTTDRGSGGFGSTGLD
ncbi:MAG: dUTP diphosphatase [Pseudomonadota bacterium]